MKRASAVLLAIILLLSCNALASNEKTKEITFRNLEWYSTKSEVETVLFAAGASTAGWGGSPENIYRMEATNFSNVTMGSERVDGGGYKAWYRDISVAGYTPSDTYACYVFPIVDGALIHDDEQAEFYFGWYTFDSADFSNHQAIYDDLKSKLESLYGDGNLNITEYNTTVKWEDTQGNIIRLLINAKKNYVTLGYMAAGADSRLDAVKKALEAEKIAAEDAERKENETNNSGL